MTGTKLSFQEATNVATSSDVLPGILFVKVSDLRSHANYHSCESLDKAKSAIEAECRVWPVRADILAPYIGAIAPIAEATRNGCWKVASDLSFQLAYRIKSLHFKYPDGYKPWLRIAVKELTAHGQAQQKAGRAVKAHVGRTMLRVSEFSQRKAEERAARQAFQKKNRKRGKKRAA
jgi:hypothetical protein